MINGVASAPFKVTRGVRQGDPLSCLLFDLAIEPLACMLRKSDLRGYNVPGVIDKIIVTLFADDTMTYLSEFDDYGSLLNILDKWCLVSRAKFNKEKTEAVPMGTPEYRESVLQTRRLSPNAPALPNDLNLTPDGSSIRSLGAWIGNGADQMAPWTAVTKKVNTALVRWGRCNPTLRGKRLIVQMIVAGMTQYLTKAQGMPDEIENRLIRITRNFIWNDARTSPVSMETLSLPIREGGIKLIDIKARNEAVELTWLRGYLNDTKNRPTWAYVADVLICHSVMSVDRNTIPDARVNPYLQTWHTSTHGTLQLPKVLKSMFKIARKYNTDFQAIKLTRALKKKMPAWYHRGAINPSRRLLHKAEGDCLRKAHDVRTIADLIKMIKRGEDPQVRHSNRWDCACPYCRSDRTDRGCDNPNKCYKAAKGILENMSPKWHHGYEPPDDNLTLTERRHSRNHRAHKTNGKILFNPSVTTRDRLSDGFRVFTSPEVQDRNPAYRQARGVEVEDEAVTVYTDGSCLFNGDDDAKAGSGVWFGDDDPRNISCRVPGTHQSNQAGEIFAIQKAAEATPPFAPLHIISDSKYAIEGLTKHLGKWQDEGWLDVANAKLFKAAAYQLQKRSARTTFEWTKGHNDNEGNEGADDLAGEGARKADNNEDTLQVPHQWNITGTKIACLTQALAYKGIRGSQSRRRRHAADTPLDMARHCVRDHLGGKQPTDATIWHGIRHKDISRNISDFLWRATHQSQRVGRYWNHIPGYEQRALCPLCEEEESMEHILVNCTSPERQVIWTLAEKAWQKKHESWPPIHMGNIIGAPLAKFDDAEGRRLPGATRLYRILMTESAHLIWKIRCERRIQRTDIEGDTHSQAEITNRWFAAMNTRLRLDCEMTHVKYGKRKLDCRTVERTWNGLLNDEKDLPPAWAKPGFLVGMGPL